MRSRSRTIRRKEEGRKIEREIKKNKKNREKEKEVVPHLHVYLGLVGGGVLAVHVQEGVTGAALQTGKLERNICEKKIQKTVLKKIQLVAVTDLHDVGGEAVRLLLGCCGVELLEVGVGGGLGHRLPGGRGEGQGQGRLGRHHHQQHQLVTRHAMGLWSLMSGM